MPKETPGCSVDFCSSAIVELHGCNECRKCRSIFCPASPKVPTVGALIHAIRGVAKSTFTASFDGPRRRILIYDEYTAMSFVAVKWESYL
ncbi:MAG: hypothetical protein CVV06_09585 [Gammaproteobacteria bacterium HGW-Gammaproteobacteria-10]|nr:MAG: hypothetical protein CVV06_09585 [Gammaproteobacteria bacterium HGW-Gammaproteobacteria-10]